MEDEDKRLYRVYDGDTKKYLRNEHLTRDEHYHYTIIGYDLEIVLEK